MIGIFNGFTIRALWIMTITVLLMVHTDGQVCPRDEAEAQSLDPSRTCRKACTTDADCSGASKSCNCDGDCGFSCFNPNAVCNDILSISDGSIRYTYPSGATGTDKVYDTRARHSCNSGYQLLGETNRYCRSDKEWSHSHNVPYCKRVCDAPGRVADGIPTTFGPFYVGDKVTIRCVTGYEAVSGSVVERTCQADYTWSDVAYTCRLKQCGPPADVSHGSYTVRDGRTGDERFGFGAWVDYKCDTGYEAVSGSVSERSCQADHTWSDVAYTCRLKQCGPPADVSHGNYTVRDGKTGDEEFGFGAWVDYECDPGYNREGGKDSYSCTIRGSDDGVSWKDSYEDWPTCVAVECPPPTTPENGQHNSAGINEFSFGDRVTYSCDRGYKLIGNEKGQCNATSGWGATPKCEGSVDEDFCSRTNSYTTTSGSFTLTEGTQISGLTGYFMQGGGTIQSVPISLTKDQRICVKADYSETDRNESKAQASNNGRTKDLLSFPASEGWTTTTFWLELVDNNADGQVRLQFVSSDNVRIDNIKEVPDSQCGRDGGPPDATLPPTSGPTTTTDPAAVTDPNNGLPPGVIAVIVVAVLLAAACVGVFVYWKFFHATKGYAGPSGVTPGGEKEDLQPYVPTSAV